MKLECTRLDIGGTDEEHTLYILPVLTHVFVSNNVTWKYRSKDYY